MSEKQQIQTLEKVFQIILLSFELSNSVEETVPKPLIEDLKEVIEYYKSEGAELDVCVSKMKEFNKKVSFYEVFEEGGLVNDNPIASVVGGEVFLFDNIVNSAFKSKEECNGNGIFDAVKFKKHIDKTNETFGISFDSNPIQIVPAESNLITPHQGEEIKSLLSSIKKSCIEIKNEALTRWGGDCTFEDPAEDIESYVEKIESFLDDNFSFHPERVLTTYDIDQMKK